MDILIVTTYFPPQNAIASLRSYSWAKWFTRFGCNVTVLTTVKKEIPDKNIDFPFELIQLKIPIVSEIKKSNAMSQNDPENIKFSMIKKLYLNISDRYGFNTIRFPDYHELWIITAKKYLMTSRRKWDIVITTAGPYCVHRIGFFCKKKLIVKKWIADWRDLFTHNPFFKGFPLFYSYERFLECKFNNNADLITTVSIPLADDIKKNTKTTVKVIYNGFDPDDYYHIKNSKRKNDSFFTLAYTGSIYRKFRDPTLLFEALSNLKKVRKLQIKLIFAGPANADMFDLAKKFNIEEYYSYVGMLPRSEALNLQYNADALLFLARETVEDKGILTGKLFEYLYIGREIWAIGVTDKSSAGTLIQETNAGICFGDDVKKIENYIEYCLANSSRDKRIKNQKKIDEFDRKNQTKILLSLIERMLP
jgi:hypothetical protein